ncbi:PREDICTED: uncharacterized protein LOC109326400 [Lupinus angustifolius]|uniref:uncharacterized protein LOC109326400 n=1 Tax=Lupinus angustifolius TaxID=3871 RepID=UPI00092FCC45|nr:PREDICTED: uncharacterized protein LOC109326400 [Lupinus angustifolius]
MFAPTDSHYKAAIRALHYLKACPAQGLYFAVDSTLILKAFEDSDWASCLDTRKSTTGFYIFLGNSIIFWKTKKESTIIKSSSEAEYRVLASLACELQWLQYLFNDLHIPSSSPTSIYCDNRSTIYLAHNPISHEHPKYIEIDCHVIREKTQQGLVHLLPISSAHQLADVFTKSLWSRIFHGFISKLSLCNLHSPS